MVLDTGFGRTPRINDNNGQDNDNGFHTGPVDNLLLANLQPKGPLHQTLAVLGTEFGLRPRTTTTTGGTSTRNPGMGPRVGDNFEGTPSQPAVWTSR